VDNTQKKPVGRPRKYEKRRPTWTVRLEESLAEQVKMYAETCKFSFSEACEMLIGRSMTELPRMQRAELRAEAAIKALEEQLEQARTENRRLSEELTEALHEAANRPAFEEGLEAIVERAVRRAMKG
jgi:hypothetical protein